MAARISTNPIVVKELQAAKMMNLQTDKLDRMEKLMGENGNFQTQLCLLVNRNVHISLSFWGAG